MTLADRSVQVLTTEYDNLPSWSPDGQRIAFTRRHSGYNYGQIFIVNADGSGKRQLTDSLWEDVMPTFVPAAGREDSSRLSGS